MNIDDLNIEAMNIDEKKKKLKELLEEIPVANTFESARLATQYRHLKLAIKREEENSPDSG